MTQDAHATARLSAEAMPAARAQLRSHGRHAVAQHCAITFLAQGRIGMRLVAEAVERHRAEPSGIYDVTVSDATGAVTAWPYTLIRIKPTNDALRVAQISPEARRLIERWGLPHAGRTGLGAAAVLGYLWALR